MPDDLLLQIYMAVWILLRNLLETKIKLTKQDALFLLGDYIDRGKNSGLYYGND